MLILLNINYFDFCNLLCFYTDEKNIHQKQEEGMENVEEVGQKTELDYFLEIDKNAIKRGYGRSRHQEIRSQMWQQMVKLNPEIKDEGGQGPTAVYTYTSSTSRMTAKICSGFIIESKTFKKRGYIFCLIEDPEERDENGHPKVVYWATLTKRTMTRGMVEKIDMRSWLCVERVRNAPVCQDPACRMRFRFRSKHHVTGRTSHWWQCPNVAHHGRYKCPRKGPDYNLPDELKAFVKVERTNRDRDALDPRRKTPRKGKFGKRKATWTRGKRKLVVAS